MSCIENISLSRRRLIGGAAASLALWGSAPRLALAGTRDPRLLTLVLRGGLDGLAVAAPVGDPDYQRLRGNIALPATGEHPGLALDGFFALNPNMPFLHQLYQKREALLVHAVHTPYRERSHFDGQDVLEGGLAGAGVTPDDGWLNRALAGLPSAGAASPKGLAMGATVPLVMRGKSPVLSWIPKVNNLPLREDTVRRLTELYGHTDQTLATAFAQGLDINRVAEAGAKAAAAVAPQPGQPPAAPRAPLQREFIDTAEAAARFLASADGPRIGALSYNGWDTHANEGVVQGQLGNRLGALDQALKALADGMGPAWQETVVLVVTEFGRTARVNGTEGTDHGSATVALLAGGAVKGGRVIADWPGLADKNLHEGRDLRPTTDLRAIIKGVLRDHLGVPDGVLAARVFPDSVRALGTAGLIG